ncbi:hypothetical protein V6N13_066408 [Hibiscus sabdariffa]|uniref:Uncharacterized protein n=1 Tax=Hibiscus sabdariffa TaxID=183260 RepID=A0ABR2DTF2_9ROSI
MNQRGSNRKPSLNGVAIKIIPIRNMANASATELAAMRASYNLEEQIGPQMETELVPELGHAWMLGAKPAW